MYASLDPKRPLNLRTVRNRCAINFNLPSRVIELKNRVSAVQFRPPATTFSVGEL